MYQKDDQKSKFLMTLDDDVCMNRIMAFVALHHQDYWVKYHGS